jgi:hypothetical protein
MFSRTSSAASDSVFQAGVSNAGTMTQIPIANYTANKEFDMRYEYWTA